MHATQRTAGDREILRERRNGTAVDLTDTGNDAVARKDFPLQLRGLVIDMRPGFLEGILIIKTFDPLTRGQLSLLMTLREFIGAAAKTYCCATLVQLL